ncbi:ATP synthase subunit d, mitochondrial-like [Ylistrum balloti]|uniref:ATP synthase subunit d, mitochondrial-like n=1 Tax=Ylistrum balloti TaxID=509963 RepID=UPI002905EFC6|nr:ATP synthase subunit d, mitochondrial-like [Ylistrum balloti]
MASKRLATSAVNWKALGERVSEANLANFKKFKLLSDTYAGKVSQLPETLPKIDFARYKSLGAPAAVVDSIEKTYGSAKVSYPVDANNSVAKIGKELDEMKVNRTAYVAEQNKTIQDLREMIDVCKKAFPPKDEWTIQLYTAYFPDCVPDPELRPTIFPHTMLNEEFFGDVARQSQAFYDFDLSTAPMFRMPYSSTTKNEYTVTRDPEFVDLTFSYGYNPTKQELEKIEAEWPGKSKKYWDDVDAKTKEFWLKHEEGKELFRELKETIMSKIRRKK